jgi:hypothetical protein
LAIRHRKVVEGTTPTSREFRWLRETSHTQCRPSLRYIKMVPALEREYPLDSEIDFCKRFVNSPIPLLIVDNLLASSRSPQALVPVSPEQPIVLKDLIKGTRWQPP